MVYLKYNFSLKIKMDFFSNLRHCAAQGSHGSQGPKAQGPLSPSTQDKVEKNRRHKNEKKWENAFNKKE